MSMHEIVRFLCEHEGERFSRDQLCKHLGMHPGTLSTRIQLIRKHWLYAEYFRTDIGLDHRGWKISLHYAKRGSRRALFKRE